eukprot:jgi/Tetstr1/436864/TSEL_025640.t1
MHLACAATFDPFVYVRCAPRAGCPRSGHHVFHGAQAAARAATCEFCSPPTPTAPPPGVALPASAAGVRALQRQHAPAAASAAHDAALAATARWSCAALVRRLTLPTSVCCLTPLRRSLPSMPFIRLLLPPARSTYSPSDEPPDLQRAPPSWGDNADEKDDPAAREERGKSVEPLRVRPLGVGSVLERLASAHALGQVGADAREVMGPDGAVYMGAPISPYPEWMTGALERRREAHTTLLERIASFGTSGYGCHQGAMRLLVVCAVRQTGFLSRMMPPSEAGPFLEAVDAANISAAFSLLGMDAFD